MKMKMMEMNEDEDEDLSNADELVVVDVVASHAFFAILSAFSFPTLCISFFPVWAAIYLILMFSFSLQE